MKRKTFLLICAVLIAALLIGVLVACDPGSKEQGGSQTPGGTTTPGEPGITTPVNPGQDDEEQNPGQGDEGQGEGGGTQTPGDNDQDNEQGGEVTESAKLIFEKTDAGYSVTGYEGTPTVVVIPETYEGLPVTSIGWYAFNDCDSLTSVTIPDSVTSIGYEAFNDCASLETLTVAPGNPKYHSAGNCIIETATKTLVVGCKSSVIPDDGSVTSIGAYAFGYCDSLTSIVIPDSVTSIGWYAFYTCTSLTSVTIPNGVTSIGSSAFENCISLTSITIPDSVTSIEDYAFNGCYKLVEVYDKSSLGITAGSSDHGAVASHAKHVYTEEGGSWLSDTEDGFRFFYDGETGYLVAYLGDETELTLPDSFTAYDGTEVTSYQIYDYAFLNTHGMMHELIGSNASMSHPSSLTSVTIGNSVTSIGIGAFAYCDSLTSVTIGDSVTSIGGAAFAYCDSLTSVTIGDSVTSIGNGAFEGCSSLERLTVAPDNPVYRSAGNCIIETETGTLIKGCNNSVIPSDGSVTSIEDSAFRGCNSLTSIVIPDSVTSIGSSAFEDCTSLTSVTIGNGVTSIGWYAFNDCYSLTSVTIGNGVTSIGDNAFNDCDSLETLTVAPGNPKYHSEGNCIIETATKTLVVGCKSSVIPDDGSVTSIGEDAFFSCDSLTSIVIPDSVTSIGSYAFYGCDSLESITLPFVGATKDGTSNTHFGYIFGASSYSDNGNYVPSSLKEVIITGGTSIGDYAFYNCNSLTSVTIGNSVTSIGQGAFFDCSGLTSITIPDSVTSIESGAFLVCKALTSVTFEGTMAEWEAVEKGWAWNDDCPFTEVKCSDGTVSV